MGFRSGRCQCSVRSIKQGICGHIIRRSETFTFGYSPRGFCHVQMRRIWRQGEKGQSSCFPDRSEAFHKLSPCTLALPNTRKVFFLIRKESRSSKSTALSDVYVPFPSVRRRISMPAPWTLKGQPGNAYERRGSCLPERLSLIAGVVSQ